MSKLRSKIAAMLAGFVLAVPGCRADQQAVTPEKAGAVSGGAEAGSLAAIAAVEHPEELLPAGTAVLLVGKSPRRAAEVLGRDRIAREFPELYRMAAGASISVFGRDVLDPESLPSMGIDPDGRAGVALLSVEPEVFGLFVTLGDAARFRETVIEVAGRGGIELVPMAYGGAEVLREASGDAAVVMRGPFAVLVMGSNRDEALSQITQTMATIDPSQALAGTREYRRTMAATAEGDLVGYIDAPGIVQGEVAGQRRREGARAEEPAWAEKELAAARERGESAERVAQLEAQAQEQAEWDARMKTRRQAETALAELLFASMQGIAIRADAKPTGAILEIRAPMGEEAFLRRAIRNGKGEPPLSWALDGRTLALLSGHLEVDALMELVDLVARAEGDSWKEVVAELKKDTGVDVEKIRPLLTGAAGGALTMEGEPDFSKLGKGAPDWLGFTVHAEVSDPGKLETLLSEVRAQARPFGMKVERERGGPGFSFEIPDWRRVHVTAGGRHLVVTTDPALPDRLARGKAGTAEKKTRPRGAYAAMKLPDTAVTYAADMALLGWLTFAASSFDSSMTMVEDPETAEIPKSRAWKKKKRELEALQKKTDAARAKRQAAEAEAGLAAVEPVGMTVLTVREDDRGLLATGGQFVRADGIAGAVEEVIAAIQKLEKTGTNTEAQQELMRLFDEQSRLRQELDEIRQKDIDRHRARKKR